MSREELTTWLLAMAFAASLALNVVQFARARQDHAAGVAAVAWMRDHADEAEDLAEGFEEQAARAQGLTRQCMVRLNSCTDTLNAWGSATR